MVAERNPQVGKAVVILRELSADERARDLYERRIKAERDERMRLNNAIYQVARRMLRRGYRLEDIAEDTGLSLERVIKLKEEQSEK